MLFCFIDNFPPSISTAEENLILRVTIGEEATLRLTVTDPGDEFNFIIQGEFPDNPILEKISEEEFVFRWTPQGITNMPLTFVANDSSGASSDFTPTVEICACVNGGNCTLDGVLTSNITIVMGCQCTQGNLVYRFILKILNMKFSET